MHQIRQDYRIDMINCDIAPVDHRLNEADIKYEDLTKQIIGCAYRVLTKWVRLSRVGVRKMRVD
jgi:hypothetical protein